jgi:hypothetical protein
MTPYRNSSKNIGKMNLQFILNKNSPWAHMELESNVLGVARKLVKNKNKKILQGIKRAKD